MTSIMDINIRLPSFSIFINLKCKMNVFDYAFPIAILYP